MTDLVEVEDLISDCDLILRRLSIDDAPWIILQTGLSDTGPRAMKGKAVGWVRDLVVDAVRLPVQDVPSVSVADVKALGSTTEAIVLVKRLKSWAEGLLVGETATSTPAVAPGETVESTKPKQKRGRKSTPESDEKILTEYEAGLVRGEWKSKREFVREKHSKRSYAWFTLLEKRAKKRRG